MNNVLTHEHGVVGSPGFHAAFGNLEALGQVIQRLEAEFAGHLTFILLQNLVAELVFKVASDNPHDFAESGLDGIVDGVIHDGFTIGTQCIELLEATITAAHAGSKEEESRFHC